MTFPALHRSRIFRHSRIWPVVSSILVAGSVAVSAGNFEMTTDGSALTESVGVGAVGRPRPVKTAPVSVENGPQEQPDLTVPVLDVDASTVPPARPSFRVSPALQELPSAQVGSAARPVVMTTFTTDIGTPTKKDGLSRHELEVIAKEIYNAFAASDEQRAREPMPAPEVLQPAPADAVTTQIAENQQVFAQADILTTNLPAQDLAANEAIQPVVEPVVEAQSVTVEAVEEIATSDSPGLTSTAPPSVSQNVTINLINRLVQRGLLTKEDAAELIQQAEEDAKIFEERTAEMKSAIYETQIAVAQSAPPAPSDDSVRVTYVPEVVKKQIKSEIKDDLMAQAKSESWAAPRLLPPWVENLHPFADIRVRLEGDFFPDGNDNTGAFPNFNAINTGAPFDVAGNQFSPQYNVDQNRYRIRLRARAGVGMNLGENFVAGLRLATGDSNSPVSQNQSMGLPYQGQGGNFSKYAIWLDRAFIKYELGQERKKAALSVGRFDNPFFTVSEIMWDNDIGFDGFALQAEYEIFRGFTPFINGGAFPIYNTDFNFSSNQPAKFASDDKWLYAGQLGFNWKAHKDIELKFGTAYYYFQNVEGQLSSPFTPQTINDAGDTDASRPSFAQKGNTYMALRDIVPDASNDFGAINQWQYFGLATPYQNLVLTGRLEYKRFEPVTIALFGEYAKNLSYNQSAINAIAVNNRGPNDDDLSDTIGSYAGGDTAWIVGVEVGKAKMLKRWDWNVSVGYRYVESDAVIDGFNDSDFGGGGTNLKGYTIAGHLALASNVWIGIRWMSAESIAGPPYKEDIIQFDINSRF